MCGVNELISGWVLVGYYVRPYVWHALTWLGSHVEEAIT